MKVKGKGDGAALHDGNNYLGKTASRLSLGLPGGWLMCCSNKHPPLPSHLFA
jgi:hypothetical protein